MRHGIAGSKLGRNTAHRRATFRNLAAALFQHGQITTTIAKAKAVQSFVERLITLARRGDLHARRRATSLLGGDRDLIMVVKGGAADEQIEDNTLVQKLFAEIGPRFKDRPGGYTRIIKLAKHRIGDGTDLVVLQMVGDDEKHSHTSKSSRRAAADHRTAFAAKLRKGGKSEAKTAPVEEKLVEAEASAEAPAESADQTKSE
jgi:large subunit ribosomal protein L17